MRFNCIFLFCFEDLAKTHRFSFSHALAWIKAWVQMC